MADNITLNAGSGGVALAADDISSVFYPIQKLAFGALDTATLVTSSVGLPVGDAGGSLTVDNAGTFAVQATLQASTNTTEVVGDAAHDAAAAGNPVLVGGYAKAAAPTDVSADADVVNAWYLRNGAAATVLTAAGALIGGDAANGLDVDVTRISGTVTIAGAVTLAAGAAAIAKAEDVASADADVGVPALAVRKATPANTSGTDGDYEFLQMSAGRLWVDPSGVTLTVASHAVTNAGTFATQESGTWVLADDAAFTPATTKVAMVGFQADESSTDSVDEGDGGAARMTLDRKIITTPQPHTAGGLSIFRSLDLDETEEDVKTSAGQVYGWAVTNTSTTTRWLKFYNLTAANTTVGSSTPVITWGIPGNSSDDVSANVMGAMGIAFDTAICAAATTGVADADTGAPAANDVIVNIFYR